MRKPIISVLTLVTTALVATACTSTRSERIATVSPEPRSKVTASVEVSPRQAASELFYKGKSHALAGDADCARLELDASLETFRLGAAPGNAEDLLFGEQLYDSVRLYRGLIETVECERPPAEDPHDTLIAEGPGATAEELEQVGREVAGMLGGSAGTAPQSPSATILTSAFDIPVVVNDEVVRAIAYFQFRTPKHFAGALQRSGRYIPMMREMLEGLGLPQDLVYVAMIESAFKGKAHSRAAAHGFWQFIADTGRRYGLRENRYVDERSDPIKSTMAAAAYLKDLYEMFGDWHLAMAAYDTGEGRVIRALQRTGARDYWELCRTNSLVREAREYVPFVLAAAIIGKDPQRFGFDVVPDTPMAFDVVRIGKPLELARVAAATGTPIEELELLNSELKTRSTPRGGSDYELRLPPGKGKELVARIAGLPEAPEILERRVKVKKGDTVTRVAQRHGVSVAELCDFNDISRKTRLKPGGTLTVPVHPAPQLARKTTPATLVAEAKSDPSESGVIRALPTPSSAISFEVLEPASAARTVTVLTASPAPAPRPLPNEIHIPREGFVTDPPAPVAPAAAAQQPKRPNASSAKAKSQRVVHTVKAGDTLFTIAKRYGLSVAEVRKQNQIRRNMLAIGQRLTLTLAVIH